MVLDRDWNRKGQCFIGSTGPFYSKRPTSLSYGERSFELSVVSLARAAPAGRFSAGRLPSAMGVVYRSIVHGLGRPSSWRLEVPLRRMHCALGTLWALGGLGDAAPTTMSTHGVPQSESPIRHANL
eukprot:scaffold31771_cov129-Isochrysis_galbana.AAC.2